jgi:hypothetical protein
VEKYIAFLEREDRAAWQKPDAVVQALGLKGTETLVDLGAGSGYFSFLQGDGVSSPVLAGGGSGRGTGGGGFVLPPVGRASNTLPPVG